MEPANPSNSPRKPEVPPGFYYSEATEKFTNRFNDFFRGGSPVRRANNKLDTSDIKGTRPRFQEVAPIQGRDYMYIRDIPGATPYHHAQVRQSAVLFQSKHPSLLRGVTCSP